MSNRTMPERQPGVLFFGMQGNFSYAPLYALLERGIEVSAVVIPSSNRIPGGPAILRREQTPSSRRMLPLLDSTLHTSILELAWERKIPVREVGRLSDPEAISALAEYRPDMICVACFSQRIPRVILNMPRFGCLNVHPSLLPANRGPDPLFWTFREGNPRTGVTIHLIDEGMDTGDILAQEAVEVPDGISYGQLEKQCSILGGRLLASSVWNLYNGQSQPLPQDESKSSYHPLPSEDDCIVHPGEWDARHVFNFICGLASWDEPIRIAVGNRLVPVKAAISYSHVKRDDSSIQGEELWIACRNGSVKVRCEV